jgi:hypothetical protein
MQGVLGTMGVFLSNGLRPRSRLARALVPILLLKVCLVILAKIFVFGGEHRIDVTPSLMGDHLTAPLSSPSREY